MLRVTIEMVRAAIEQFDPDGPRRYTEIEVLEIVRIIAKDHGLLPIDSSDGMKQIGALRRAVKAHLGRICPAFAAKITPADVKRVFDAASAEYLTLEQIAEALAAELGTSPNELHGLVRRQLARLNAIEKRLYDLDTKETVHLFALRR